MAAENNLTEKFAKAQSIDFVEQFGKSIKKLLEMLKIERRMTLPVGATIKTYSSKVTLDGTKVAKGDIIPLSKVETTEGDPIELAWDKKRKAVAIEDIQAYGFEQAVSKTDTELLRELQKEIKKNFFAQLAKGTTSVSGVGLQGAMAKAWGGVAGKFEDDDVTTIAFVNPTDVADYLATAQITVQTAFGLRYVENFLGVDVAIMSTSVPAKTLYATASDNLCLAQANMAGSEIAKAFDFTTDETGIIGVTHDVNKQRLTAETVTASATVLFAERLDGIVKATITEAAAAAKA
ncbi:hypothetical protein [Peptacetobacter sp.]|uniref:hypothetical protein n=1 Tax=unclassified Peptacetobacter TaxID=2991974 RepID=UPI002E7A638C|nr:hypothetical protein [Peptacetobacter sp.]MEE0451313.1 hypothetical protein [Peptacetobacter sp.]